MSTKLKTNKSVSVISDTYINRLCEALNSLRAIKDLSHDKGIEPDTSDAIWRKADDAQRKIEASLEGLAYSA